MTHRRPARRAGLAFVVSAGFHAVFLTLALSALAPDTAVERLRTLTVRILVAKPAEPVPVKAAPHIAPPSPAPVVSRLPAPVMAAHDAPTADFSVPPPPAPQPAAVAMPEADVPLAAAPAPVALPAAPPPVLEAARFDADYLNNPRPTYPLLSRRLGEEGRVLLRVQVSAEGAPLTVVVKQSSGYARLDEAAMAAVHQWRFVPARRGSAAEASWVQVPLIFKLSR